MTEIYVVNLIDITITFITKQSCPSMALCCKCVLLFSGILILLISCFFVIDKHSIKDCLFHIFICHIVFAGKQFGRLHNLQGHIHMHTNSKPYVCFCGSSFTLRGTLIIFLFWSNSDKYVLKMFMIHEEIVITHRHSILDYLFSQR